MDTLTVELIGARGVGKSTLAELLSAELRARNLLVDSTLSTSLADKLARQLFTLADRSRFMLTSLAWRPLTARDLRNFRKRYRRVRLNAVNGSRHPGVNLIDEGVFQLIMELQAKTAQKDIGRIATRIAGLTTFPDVVVVVEATEEAIEERRRGRGNRGDLLRPHVVPWERSALDDTKRLLASLAESGSGTEVIVVRNRDSSSPIRIAARLADEIADRFANRSEGYANQRRDTQLVTL